MLQSLALIILLGMFAAFLCKKCHMPGLLGLLLTGIILGPHCLNLLSPSIQLISPDLRKIALLIILTRAGLSLDIKDLKQVGRPAILMCFVPACLELLGMLLLAPRLLNISLLEAAILGTVVAAVSPAVIVPKMIHLIDHGYGTKQSIPQLILAGASVDDVFVIVLFTSFTGLAAGGSIKLIRFMQIPISILTGCLIGLLVGVALTYLFSKMHINDTSKVLILLSISFLLVGLEDRIGDQVPFSGLLAVMSVGIALQHQSPALSKQISVKFKDLWIAAEILLFVLVGATVDINYAISAGANSILLLLLVLLFRMLGVFLCMIGTSLTMKERLFCMIAYTPKATVQAAIGGIPLAMGLPCGNLVLTVAILAILITAPFGAFAIDLSYKKLLCKE